MKPVLLLHSGQVEKLVSLPPHYGLLSDSWLNCWTLLPNGDSEKLPLSIISGYPWKEEVKKNDSYHEMLVTHNNKCLLVETTSWWKHVVSIEWEQDLFGPVTLMACPGWNPQCCIQDSPKEREQVRPKTKCIETETRPGSDLCKSHTASHFVEHVNIRQSSKWSEWSTFP